MYSDPHAFWALTDSTWFSLFPNKRLLAPSLPCDSYRNVAAEVKAKCRHQVEGEIDDEAEVEYAK